MSKYQRKFIINLIAGLSLITTGLSLLLYASFTRREDNWKSWAIIVAAITVTGLLLLGSAFISKVKADFIRKQKGRS